MKNGTKSFLRITFLVFIWGSWWWSLNQPLSPVINLSVIVGGVLLTYPLAWLAGKNLRRHPTMEHAVRTTTFVHIGLGFTFGVPFVRAVSTYNDWTGWVIPIPPVLGLGLVIVSGAAFLLTVINLALKGSGAPFYIVLSQKLAADWMYAWTRNPMALTVLALFLSLGIWFQSTLFLIWVIFDFAPAYVFFAKVFEEKELEIRFGPSYKEYKARTPMFWPRKPDRL